MRQAVRHISNQWVRLLHGRTILVLTLIFCAGVGAMPWHVARVQENLIVSIAVRDAALYTKALAEFRTLYTSEVVQTVRGQGIEVTHDYSSKSGTIPLPATLSMLLGRRLGAYESGAQVRLYSPYPFPRRQQEGGLQDTFAQEAWEALQHRPHAPFYRFEGVQGRRSLRYATADRLRPSCINCRNTDVTHVASPKNNWNPQAETIFGWCHRDIVEQPLAATIIPSPYRQAHTRGMQRFLATGEGSLVNKRIEITALHRDGHEFPVELAITPGRAGNTVVFSAFVRDITERKRAEAELKQALTASEAHRQELERFNRFAVGRELRMIELKQQVHTLLLAQGERPRFNIDRTEEEHV